MDDMKVWFITGASRGMGTEFASAALEAGHAVVATGRRTTDVTEALGASDRLLVATLDVTSQADAEAAVATGVDHFGRVDVVVNSAGASFKGYFEEMSPAQVEQQLAVNLLGPMNVTRAVLPVMRQQRSGHLIAISSGAGLMGFEYSSVYAASKAGLEGWMSALAQEVVAVRHPHDDRQSGILPDGTGQSGVAGMARSCRSTTTRNEALRSASGGQHKTGTRRATRPSWRPR